MRTRVVYCIAAVLLVIMCLGCSTSNVGTLDGPGHEASRFTLAVDDNSFFNGSTVDGFTLTEEEYDDHVLVNVNAQGARDLKALYFELDYNPEQFRPMMVEPTEAMGRKDSLLRLDIRKERGTVAYGQVLTNPDWREGLSGDATVATVVFRKEATPVLKTTSAATPPMTAASQPTLLLDTDTGMLSWYYYHLADYNQDGLVSLHDMTAIGQNYLERSPTFPDFFPEATAQSAVDGQKDGAIEITDITPIGQNYNSNALAGYNIYEGALGDVPVEATDGNGAGVLVANVSLDDRLGDKVVDRLRFEFVIPTPTADAYYWVRPVMIGTLEEGIASNGVQNVSSADRPVLTLTNEPPVGDGLSSGTAYQADTSTDYIFTLFDPISAADVTNDALTTYTVSNPAAGTIATVDATLNIDNAFWGSFTVTGTYDGTSSSPMHFYVEEPPEEAIYILPDPADADWASIPEGDGLSELTSFLILNETFNSDGTMEFSIIANTEPDGSGDAYDVTEMTWDGFPVFGQNWPAPGTFTAHYDPLPVPPMSFCGGYVFCQDVALVNSENEIYIHAKLLPD